MQQRVRDAALALTLCAMLAGTAAAQQGVRQAPGGVLLNFQAVELAQVIEALAQAAGLNVVLTDIPSKPVTMRTTQAVSRADLAGLIRSLAEANGVSVVEGNGFLRLQGRSGSAQEDLRELYIHRLQHARAQVLGLTLQQLFGGAAVRPGTATAGGGTLSQQLRTLEIQAQVAGPQGGAQQGPIIVQPRPGTGELQSQVVIVPDEVTNSLLIRATAPDWQVIQHAIRSLDLRPLQVVIEVIIAEVQRTHDLNIGTSFTASDATARPGRSTVGSMARDAGPDDFTLRMVRTGDINIEATLSALSASGRVRILSRPVIVAQNNQEARILVGSQRPFVQVARPSPLDPTPYQIVQYLDVGTSLRILPTINADGYVNLAVSQEISSATNEVQFDAPVLSTREATTQLLARNGQTVVIGGLVDRQTDRFRAGIPLLKDIPILGYLFGTTREHTGASELFLFLTPYIVATDEDADRLREEIEANAELIRPFTPIRPIVPSVRPILPPPDTLRRPDPARPDTIPRQR
jgi:general secretion pathway protein D